MKAQGAWVTVTQSPFITRSRPLKRVFKSGSVSRMEFIR